MTANGKVGSVVPTGSTITDRFKPANPKNGKRLGEVKMALNSNQVKSKQSGIYADGDGLYLVVRESGDRVWAFRFTDLEGKRFEHHLLEKPRGVVAQDLARLFVVHDLEYNEVVGGFARMNLQQIRILGTALQHNLNLTEVARALNTSQSGVSKHVMDLESELGFDIFIRHGKRIVGLTEAGKELAPLVERIMFDLKNIGSIASHFSRQDVGRLTLATTHTQARYSLPSIVSRFKQEFPGVELVLHQGSPAEIVALVMSGRSDIAVATDALDGIRELVTFPYYRWHHAVIVPDGHPLLRCDPLTIEQIAEFPIVTYSEGFSGRTRVEEAFAKVGVTPNLAISALDADVIKTYVELGLGVGIVAAMAVKPEGEGGLRVLPSEHLFEASTTRVAVRRGTYLRRYACRFISLCETSLSDVDIRKAVLARD